MQFLNFNVKLYFSKNVIYNHEYFKEMFKNTLTHNIIQQTQYIHILQISNFNQDQLSVGKTIISNHFL